MGLEEKLPDGILLASVEKSRQLGAHVVAVAGHLRAGLLRHRDDGDRRRPLRPGPLRHGGLPASPRQADLMIVAGRVSQKMAPVLRQIYDQMPEPKWVIAMGVCASSGGMFNNYAIVQGVDHVVPVDMYLPGCPPRPEMLMDAILKLHDKIRATPLGPNRAKAIERKGLPIVPYEKPADVAVREREEAEERTARAGGPGVAP